MAVITPTAIQKFRKALAESLLGEGEMRKVEGMGALFISRVLPEKGRDGYTWLYSLEIDGITYHFYSNGNP